jgi:uncharacterized protein (DUF4415 family)
MTNTSKKLSAKRIAEIKAFKDTDFSDSPIITEEQMKQFKPSHLRSSESYRPVKKDIHVRLDADIIEWLKHSGKGYQTRLNAILRQAMLKDAN